VVVGVLWLVLTVTGRWRRSLGTQERSGGGGHGILFITAVEEQIRKKNAYHSTNAECTETNLLFFFARTAC
jgi:hypothetical protein